MRNEIKKLNAENSFRLFLFALALCFQSELAMAREAVEALWAIPQYHWRIAHGAAPSVLLLNLESNRGDYSPIEFGWELPSGMKVVEQRIDPYHKIISPKPGRETWYAHPGQNTSNEEFFLDSLRSVGYSSLETPYIKRENGRLTFSTIEDFLSIARAQHQPMSFNQLIANVDQEVKSTRKRLLEKLLHSDNRSLIGDINAIAGAFDVVEPVESQEDGRTRIDGFCILPLLQLEKSGTSILELLASLSQQKKFYPIEWYYQNSSVPEDIRLAVISLITHNHRAERIFIAGAALRFGVDRAWKAARDINQLYQKEQESIRALDSSRLRTNNSLRGVIPNSNVPFLDQYNSVEVLVPGTS